jgi:hypothetical protein
MPAAGTHKKETKRDLPPALAALPGLTAIKVEAAKCRQVQAGFPHIEGLRMPVQDHPDALQ